MLKIHIVPTGLHHHINKVIKNTRDREICFKMQKELDQSINQVGRESLLSKMRRTDFDRVYSNIRNNKVFKKLNKIFKGKGKMIAQIAFMSIFAVVANPFMPIALAETDLERAISLFNRRMWEVCKMIFTIGGWGFVCAAIKEIMESMIKKEDISILSIIIKYIIAFISMLLMPRILEFAKTLILG